MKAALWFGIVAAMAAVLLVGSKSGFLLAAGIAALAVGLCVLMSPVFAAILLLVTMFMRLPIRSEIALPVELFLLVFAALVAATVLWMDRTPGRVRGLGPVEWAMAAYLACNVYSMLAAHEYPAGDPLLGVALPIPRFIVIAVGIPFALYVIGRYVVDSTSAVRAVLWAVLGTATYSAAVSIMPAVGLSDLVWPRYIVTEIRPSWAGRAVGIFNQPVVNGMVLALGFAIALVLLSRRSDPGWQRCAALAVAVASGCGLYLTHTRAVWLAGVAVLIIGAVLAKGYRKGFVAILVMLGAMVAVNWSTFTSADRTAGGVASDVELESRLNDMQTALWAFAQRPIEGWGIGRFQSVNTIHHQQWASDVPWASGFGEVSHQNELAILAELGIIGLTAWIAVLALIAHRLWKAYRTLPDQELCGKPLVVIAMMALAIMLCAGITVDLRYFDFSTATIFLLLGVAVGWSDRHNTASVPNGDDQTVRDRQLEVVR
ncbi:MULTISPECIES: O-antigen ligase family protein [Mycobacteriaceae]|uniref:O-antigen ligase-related domain-containing protein n=1 Tax=Mycolicibacterium neoaurum VKM Ac-1815D TaxID=700508 RepID=V5XJT0_MYCNE|nr:MULTISPECIES: O-antigen ligase family protein [Mycobacteriaceae]KUM06308.1 hypothetical protein AVZ31_22320 [Mycolicibacterium neoaurum]